mmetsp:Transcript_62428/g.111017  ORF Transcript_62428/g.111017 Transcript_62428/m.111017 type:complete len:86 (-) Transcript_62428:4-261(-)
MIRRRWWLAPPLDLHLQLHLHLHPLSFNIALGHFTGGYFPVPRGGRNTDSMLCSVAVQCDWFCFSDFGKGAVTLRFTVEPMKKDG